MVPKPGSVRLAFVFGMVLAVAMTIVAVMTWPESDLAAPNPPAEPIYQPQYLILFAVGAATGTALLYLGT